MSLVPFFLGFVLYLWLKRMLIGRLFLALLVFAPAAAFGQSSSGGAVGFSALTTYGGSGGLLPGEAIISMTGQMLWVDPYYLAVVYGTKGSTVALLYFPGPVCPACKVYVNGAQFGPVIYSAEGQFRSNYWQIFAYDQPGMTGGGLAKGANTVWSCQIANGNTDHSGEVQDVTLPTTQPTTRPADNRMTLDGLLDQTSGALKQIQDKTSSVSSKFLIKPTITCPADKSAALALLKGIMVEFTGADMDAPLTADGNVIVEDGIGGIFAKFFDGWELITTYFGTALVWVKKFAGILLVIGTCLYTFRIFAWGLGMRQAEKVAEVPLDL